MSYLSCNGNFFIKTVHTDEILIRWQDNKLLISDSLKCASYLLETLKNGCNTIILDHINISLDIDTDNLKISWDQDYYDHDALLIIKKLEDNLNYLKKLEFYS